MHLLITTAPGLGKVLEQELITLDYKPHHTFNTGTYIDADMKAMMYINLWSRTANKVYQHLGHIKDCQDFDTLFAAVEKIKRNNFVPLNSPIIVHVHSHESKLHAQRVIQSVAHKAVLVGLTGSQTRKRDINEHKPPIEIRITLFKNTLNIRVNTSGDALYQRGYKTGIGDAPIKENIAAALVLISKWNPTSTLIDPCCGSGSIPIEAALIATNKAPGLHRRYAFERFPNCDRGLWNALTKEAKKQEKRHSDAKIFAYDLDQDVLKKAKNNADNAGVGSLIKRERQNILSQKNIKNSHIITNPPYGKRLDQAKIKNIHEKLIELSQDNSTTIITNYESMPQDASRTITETKNGAEKCKIYHKTHISATT